MLLAPDVDRLLGDALYADLSDCVARQDALTRTLSVFDFEDVRPVDPVRRREPRISGT